MKKYNSLSEGEFLLKFFLLVSTCFLAAALFMPDRAQMFSGYWQILSQPCKVATNYFAVGGYAATFLNMALVGYVCTALFLIFHSTPNNVSNLGVLLTIGFGTWGIHVLNILPTMLGVLLYCWVKKEKVSSNVNAMIYSTGIAPLISDLLLRYPHPEVVGVHPLGLVLALAVGLFIGFILPAGMSHSPNVHKGFDLYSAALPIGMTAFLLQALLFKTMGVAIPAAPDKAMLDVASPMIVNGFCIAFFGLCILLARLMGCTAKDYWHLLRDPELVKDFALTYNNATFLMNVGVFGLFILLYYNLTGVKLNGVTLGIIFCMLSTCNSGSHPGNVWPIMLGYAVMSFVCGWLSKEAGGTFAGALSAQAIAIGLCYANGLSPISDRYGWFWGFVAASLHYILVTSVPSLHGGFCLYNGGFTAALICMILVPQLERFFGTDPRHLNDLKKPEKA